MAQEETTFGSAIADARKKKGWSLKDLCAKVLREDGDAISPQYLNDIEHDRRSPSSDRMVTQFAEALGLGDDVVVYPTGGPLAANPMMAAGLLRIGEVANRISDGSVDRGVAHATSGHCLQQNLVCVLEGE